MTELQAEQAAVVPRSQSRPRAALALSSTC